MEDAPLSPVLDALSRSVTREFDAWEASLPKQRHRLTIARFPDPRADGGLPFGWGVVARYPDYQPDTDLVLVRRPTSTGGGWVIVRHEHDLLRTAVFWMDATLGDLYEHVLEEATEGRPSSRRLDPVADWLKSVLIAMFDATDPVEAAEQMLFALGGSLGLLPARAS